MSDDERQAFEDELNLLLWHEVRLSNNRDSKIASSLMKSRDSARTRLLALYMLREAHPHE
jgi:hypothetical protein